MIKKLLIGLLSICVFTAMVLSSPNQQGEEREKESKGLESLSKTIEELIKSNKKTKLGGYFQIIYEDDEKNNGKNPVKLQRARIAVSGDLTDKIHFKIQPDFAPLSVGKDVSLKDFYIDLKYVPNGLIKFGQFKIPFGYELLLSSSKRYTINKMAYVKECFPSDRDFGVGIFGDFPGSLRNYISYALVAVNGTGRGVENNGSKDIATRLEFNPIPKILKIGITGYTGIRSDSKGNQSSFTYGTFIQFDKKSYDLIAEYVGGKDKTGKNRIQDLSFWIITRPSFLPKFEPLFRYEIWDPDTSISGDRQNILTLGLNYHFDKSTRLMIQYEIKREELIKIKNDFFGIQLQVSY